ncbi:hypothetical protein BGW36DRAFT_439426 [Talaromyces proteolyticus]|uniref:Zn(2)-C6 fungal-type domain-containing protein n=1 Tax=Talaromyces proteolyticus TaxID=1131652 RepID=A0AAD4KG99_9EURO|nr:uncharacterized protein BGW36DRAFT_439426 [Talaromyces proteolyticus]KAH8691618.1 hypothetical protein BGW36DRAFT_439426 [Talaromyces proteolyticus]
MASGSRRSHTNSHHGCAKCKARKCDERKQSCGPCTKLGIRCDYLDYFTTEYSSTSVNLDTRTLASEPELSIKFDRRSAGAAIYSNTQRRPTNRRRKRASNSGHSEAYVKSRDVCVYAPIPNIKVLFPINHPYLDQDDLELLNHFFTITSGSMSSKGPMERRILNLVPTYVQSCDYVVYALLCISALHINHLHSASSSGDPLSRIKYHNMAVKYLGKGASRFRTAERILNSDNMDPIFTFSGMTIICELGFMGNLVSGPHQQKGQDEIDRFLQMILFIRRVTSLWFSFPLSFYETWNPQKAEMYTQVKKEMDIAELEEETLRIDNSGVIPEISSAMKRLHNLNNDTTTNSLVEREIYSEAITILHLISYHVASNPEEWALALRWLTRSTPYTLLLQNRKPLALVILGYYCVLLHRGPGQSVWWMKDWAIVVIYAIFNALDETWRHHLTWAMDATKLSKPSPLVMQPWKYNGHAALGAILVMN